MLTNVPWYVPECQEVQAGVFYSLWGNTVWAEKARLPLVSAHPRFYLADQGKQLGQRSKIRCLFSPLSSCTLSFLLSLLEPYPLVPANISTAQPKALCKEIPIRRLLSCSIKAQLPVDILYLTHLCQHPRFI